MRYEPLYEPLYWGHAKGSRLPALIFLPHHNERLLSPKSRQNSAPMHSALLRFWLKVFALALR